MGSVRDTTAAALAGLRLWCGGGAGAVQVRFFLLLSGLAVIRPMPGPGKLRAFPVSRKVVRPRLALADAVVAAARAEAAEGHAGVPVEDDRVVLGPDDDLGSRLGTGLGQGFLDAELGQPVGQEADSLVIAEVGLVDPPQRLAAAHDVTVVPGPDQLEVGPGHRLGPEHQGGGAGGGG